MAGGQDIGAACCVICGNAEYASFEEGLSTFEICPVCGRQSGYEYDTSTGEGGLAAIRAQWLWHEGARWFRGRPPAGWDAKAQIAQAGPPIPQRSEAKEEIPQ